MCSKFNMLIFVYCSHTLRPPQKRKSTSKDGSNEKVTRIKTEDGSFVTVRVQEGVVDLTLDEEEMKEVDEVDSSVQASQSPEKNNKGDKSPSHGKTDEESSGVNDSEKDSSKTENNASTSEEKCKETSDSTAKSASCQQDNQSDKGSKEKGETSWTKDTAVDQNIEKDKLDMSDGLIKGQTGKEIIDKSKEESKGKEDDMVKESVKTERSSGHTDYTEMKEEDIKPDKQELDKKLNSTKVEDNNTTEEKKVFVHKAAQTVPTVVKFASPEEVDLLRLCPVEQKQALLEKSRELDDTKKELDDTQKTLKRLQDNIWQLLKIIVPDFDYGEPENIEKIILDFIRVNGDQIDKPSTSGN